MYYGGGINISGSLCHDYDRVRCQLTNHADDGDIDALNDCAILIGVSDKVRKPSPTASSIPLSHRETQHAKHVYSLSGGLVTRPSTRP